MWRPAEPDDDSEITAMCLELYREDPSPIPVPAEKIWRTLAELRKHPQRGRALVLEHDGAPAGYALLISFWSNEVGGEICTVDEFYVRPEQRGRGHGTRLLEGLRAKTQPWSREVVAVDLEVTPDNRRARELYLRMGFQPAKNTHMRIRL